MTKRVLIIEDNERNLYLTSFLLEKHNYTVVQARDGMEGIRLAGMIHDLGKIYIPAEILSKPGRLTDLEFSLIKNHSQVGYDILKTVAFPWPIAQIVL